jgi:dTDP-glucose 4,6-dehydratase
MRVVVAGGAGFLGSHLCEALLRRGDEVVCLDDFSTGRHSNLAGLRGRPGFSFETVDVSASVPPLGPLDAVLHLASPASPPAYLARPLETLSVGSEGTRRLLELATKEGARFVLASTSEIYGDPEVHPQPETYRGNVDCAGPRSVYDESKRFAEAMTMAFHRHHGVNVAIMRIFNTYGPRLRAGDGRVVSNFIAQALRGEPLTVYGDGRQTRSLCYVDDLVRGMVALLDSEESGPVNLGNPDERSILDLAEAVQRATGTDAPVEFRPLPTDDPTRRCPDITLARDRLGWQPDVPLEQGLSATISYFRTNEMASEE